MTTSPSPTPARAPARRPLVVAFDVVETIAPLEPVAAALAAIGLPAHALPLFFAQMLRDAFALEVAGTYRPFAEVARATLQVTAAGLGRPLADAQVDQAMAAFGTLSAAPDVGPAMQRLRDAGVRVVTLTNGSAANTQKMLERSGLAALVERCISIDEVGRWKPHASVYAHAARVCGVAPEAMALVAAHAWDIHGARSAGLQTAWVLRQEPMPSAAMLPPDACGSLDDAVQALLALPG